MEAADPLSCVYKKALGSYEELYRQRKLKPEQLALIKGQASISEVLQDISRTKVKYESERSAISKLVHKITPAYIDKLDRASKIVEVAIQSNPKIAALVWSGIKFIVLISQDIFHTYARICDIMEKISLCLERFSEIAGLYQMTKLLDSRFVTLYCDIIEFCLKTIEFYARSKWRKLAASLITIGSLHEPFDELLKKICDHAEEIEKAADVEHQKRTKNIELKVQSQAMGTVAVNPSQKTVFIPNILHPLFTGRAKQLETISQSLSLTTPSSKRIAIYGMPGAGKTQLALKL